MDFLNRGLAQLNDLFRSMTVSARVTAALLLVVVVVSVAFLFKTQSSAPDSYLLGGYPFAPRELPSIQGALAKAGLNDFEVEGNMIRIPRTKQAEYIAALADENLLPASFGDRLWKMVENQSPFASSKQHDSMLKHARDSMLAKSISEMDGIESADVYTDAKEKRGLKPEALTTASVNIRTLGGQPLTVEKVQAIRSLVAGAIAGLSRDKVSVIDATTGRHWSGDGSDGGAGVLDDPYLARKTQYEAQYKSEIGELLSYVPGAQVSVNVELSKERNRREESQKYDPKAIVPVRTSSESLTNTNESAAPAGRPGFEAQQPNRAAQLAGPRGTTSSENQERSETANLPSTEITRIDHVGLTPEKVTVSVVVPTSYFAKVWQQVNPTASGQTPREPAPADLVPIEEAERTRIQEAVFQLIPHRDEKPTDLVSVTAFTAIPVATPAGPGLPSQALSWLSQYWGALGMLALAGVSLLMLRSMTQAVPQAEEPSAPATLPLPAAQTPTSEPGESAAKSRLRRRGGSGPSLRDDLVELVREDPDAAANILKGWIGSLN